MKLKGNIENESGVDPQLAIIDPATLQKEDKTMKRFVVVTLAIVFIGGMMLLLAGGFSNAGAQQTQPVPQQGTGDIKNPPPPPALEAPPEPPPDTPDPDKEKRREYETQC